MKAIERLEKIFKQRSINVSELSRKIGVSSGYFNSMSSKKGDLGEEVIIKVCKELNLSFEELLLGTNDHLYTKVEDGSGSDDSVAEKDADYIVKTKKNIVRDIRTILTSLDRITVSLDHIK
jgi:DNA-binding Xre family transcriptional regulator